MVPNIFWYRLLNGNGPLENAYDLTLYCKGGDGMVRPPWVALIALTLISCRAGQKPSPAPPPIVEASPPVAPARASTETRVAVAAVGDVPTSHFDRAAQLPSFYDARAVDGHLAVARCGGIRILDSTLTGGRDVTLPTTAGGCLALIGAIGKLLIVHVDGRGLFGIDVETGATRWTAPLCPWLRPAYTRPLQMGQTSHAFAGAHTCSWIALAGTTVVSAEASGKLVGSVDEGGEVLWNRVHEPFGKASRLVVDGAGHIASVLADRQTVECFDAATGSLIWEEALQARRPIRIADRGAEGGRARRGTGPCADAPRGCYRCRARVRYKCWKSRLRRCDSAPGGPRRGRLRCSIAFRDRRAGQPGRLTGASMASASGRTGSLLSVRTAWNRHGRCRASSGSVRPRSSLDSGSPRRCAGAFDVPQGHEPPSKPSASTSEAASTISGWGQVRRSAGRGARRSSKV